MPGSKREKVPRAPEVHGGAQMGFWRGEVDSTHEGSEGRSGEMLCTFTTVLRASRGET